MTGTWIFISAAFLLLVAVAGIFAVVLKSVRTDKEKSIALVKESYERTLSELKASHEQAVAELKAGHDSGAAAGDCQGSGYG